MAQAVGELHRILYIKHIIKNRDYLSRCTTFVILVVGVTKLKHYLSFPVSVCKGNLRSHKEIPTTLFRGNPNTYL